MNKLVVRGSKVKVSYNLHYSDRHISTFFIYIVYNVEADGTKQNMGEYQIFPQDWRYSANVTIKQIIESKPCMIISLDSKSDNKVIRINIIHPLQFQIFTRLPLGALGYNTHHPVKLNRTYAVQIQNRYQGKTGRENVWKLTVHIDGIQVDERLQSNIKLFGDMRYYMGGSTTCIAKVEDPELTFFEEGL